MKKNFVNEIKKILIKKGYNCKVFTDKENRIIVTSKLRITQNFIINSDLWNDKRKQQLLSVLSKL